MFWACTALLLCAGLGAQEVCDQEAKLLLSPAQTQAAVSALHGKKETTGHVYFYDTEALDLLSHGVVVRLRQGADNDLTVKLRPPTGQKFAHPSAGRERYKCEIDLTGMGATNSYAIQKAYGAEPPPATGTEVAKLLNAAQKELLAQTRVPIDWARVKRVADIRYTAWQTKSQPPFDKLTLELWQWPSGSALEVSTKVGADAGPAAYTALQQLVTGKGLSLSRVQGLKTNMVLKRLAEPPAR